MQCPALKANPADHLCKSVLPLDPQHSTRGCPCKLARHMQSRLPIGSGVCSSAALQDNQVSMSMLPTAGDVVTIAKQIGKLSNTPCLLMSLNKQNQPNYNKDTKGTSFTLFKRHVTKTYHARCNLWAVIECTPFETCLPPASNSMGKIMLVK